MKRLRKNWLKSILGTALLLVMALKVCAGFISQFSCKNDSYSIEKSAEEGKDIKEESFDKVSQKLLTCSFHDITFDHFSWISHLPVGTAYYKLRISAHPPKTVPTPPPDFTA
ncbi:hypothetical protein FPZ43_08970 [Mucilaginibacter pallidiroseus]|uniref:Uncharacterized protein n=1 Tax=Mucilaginibacter pallidiroseus TaxID=2599295 RepID=A0A563UFD0_9SPHI|nr:hypothetical protein [Mucilaginibacter pallidiroseus]TWR29969.1 hypothetical protein FPZ43_08970 [Mucilaginibacter pallidiroseus]